MFVKRNKSNKYTAADSSQKKEYRINDTCFE